MKQSLNAGIWGKSLYGAIDKQASNVQFYEIHRSKYINNNKHQSFIVLNFVDFFSNFMHYSLSQHMLTE